MPLFPSESSFGSEQNLLLPYVADLELEVDRLRTQGMFVEQSVRDSINQIRAVCGRDGSDTVAESTAASIKRLVEDLANVLHDVRERPGYHPTHDQVIAIAVRPLIEQIFRWNQRILGATKAELRLTLQVEYLNWFPARLRHILDGLISNALRYRDPIKGECRVGLDVRRVGTAYEIRVSDNGVGIPEDRRIDMLELVHRAAPARAAGLGVGLAVIKILIERSGGTLTVESSEGQGSCFKAVLPTFDVDDYLDPT